MNLKIKKLLPYSRQDIGEKDIKAILNVLNDDYITQGPRIERFEKNFANYVGSKHAVACATGTAALHISLLALGMNKNHNLITSPITFLASANCIQFLGGNTIFSDIDEKTICLCPHELEKKLKSHKIDVVIAVHMAGHSSEMKSLYDLKKKYNFFLIEDACHALGGTYNSYKVGSCKYSDISTFSFHPVKPITTAEGGMVTTNNKKLYEKLIIFRNHGMHKKANKFKNKHLAINEDGEVNPWYYEMNDLGYNYRISDIQCALGINQLKKLDFFLRKRTLLAKFYCKGLENNRNIVIPKTKNKVKHAYHLFTIRIDFKKIGKTRYKVMQELRKENIGSQVLYIPLHLQPYYSEKYNLRIGDFPKAEKYYNECLSIPLFPGIRTSEAEYIVKTLNSIIN